MGVIALLCAACAARQVTPISISQEGDDRLSCQELDQQLKANQIAAADFLQRNEQVRQTNSSLEVATIFSLWFSLAKDLSREEQIKMRSLNDRNDRLLMLKRQKDCSQ
jgi:hypothetical protein